MSPPTAEQREHLEQSRAYRFTRTGNPHGMDERRRSHTARVGHRAQRGFRGHDVERGQLRERRVNRDQMLAHSVSTQMFLHGRRVVLHRVREEEPPLRHEVVQAPGARLQQLEDGEEPRVTIAEIALVPQRRVLQARLEPAAELVRRQTRDVLLIEPVELLRVEDRIPAADPFEAEPGGEAVTTEQLVVSAG